MLCEGYHGAARSVRSALVVKADECGYVLPPGPVGILRDAPPGVEEGRM